MALADLSTEDFHDTVKAFFTDSEWDLIYNLVENNRQFCEDDEYDPVEDYNTVLNKIRTLFEENK